MYRVRRAVPLTIALGLAWLSGDAPTLAQAPDDAARLRERSSESRRTGPEQGRRARLGRPSPRDGFAGAGATNAPVDLAADVERAAAVSASPWTKAQEGRPSMFASASGPLGYVAAGAYGTIIASPNGVTWTTRRAGSPGETLWALTYGNGLFVAVGDRSGLPFILTSPNGVAWTERAVTVSGYVRLEDIEYGNGRFVGVGMGDNNAVALTSTDGVAWTTHLIESAGNPLLGVAFGRGVFVGLVPGGVLTSSDGATWTPQSVQFHLPTSDVVYDGSGFVVCGSNSTFTSPDGVSWTEHTQAPDFYPYRMAAGAGVLTAVGPSFIQTSVDGGITWTDRSGFPTPNGESRAYQTIVHGNWGFVTLAFNGTILTSLDGTAWTSRTAPASRYQLAVASGNGLFCAVGVDGAVASSTQGARWTNQRGFDPQGSIAVQPSSIVWGNGTFVAVDDLGRVYTSAECTEWSVSDAEGSWSFYDVFHGEGLFVGVGTDASTNAALLATSRDGVNWERLDVGLADASLESVAYGGGRWVAVGNFNQDWSFVTLISDDLGHTWTLATATTPPDDFFSEVIYAQGMFVGVGLSAWTSPDGLDWTKRFQAPRFMTGVAYGDGRFQAVSSGAVYASADGASWAPEPGIPARNLSGITFDANLKRFVAVGDSVTLYTPSALPGGTLQFSAAAYTVSEGPGSHTAVIRVVRSGSAEPASVDYVVSEGTADASDFTPTAGTLSFLRGQRVQTLTIDILADQDPEPRETVNLRLRNPQGGAALGTRNAAILTIKDDEPTIQFAAVGYSVSESAPAVSLVLTRTPGGCDPFCNVSFTTQSTTAGLGDYVFATGNVEFKRTELHKTLTIAILDDNFFEGPETFEVRLLSSLAASVGPQSTATVTITDDEPPPPASALHLYPAFGLDPTVSCSRTTVKVIQFVPRGEEGYVNPGWTLKADSVFQQVRAFFEREFGGQISVRYDVLSRYVVGQEPVYHTLGPVLDEIQAAVFTPGGSHYDPAFAEERAGEYTLRMIYYLNRANGQPVLIPGGGAHPWFKTALQGAFWLDYADSRGAILSAHEMGHLLGIPHPWEMSPPRPNELGNVMGYNTPGLTIMQCFILEEVKRAMGMN